MNAMDAAVICKALGDSNRIRIVELLTQGELCGCKLLEYFNITQPTLSHHMKILCDAGIVQGRRDGKWVHYSLDPAGAERAKQLLAEQLAADGSCPREGCCAEEN